MLIRSAKFSLELKCPAAPKIYALNFNGTREKELSGEGHFRELQYWYPKITTSCVDYAQLSDRICELIELRLRDKISPPRKIEIPTLLLKAEQ